MPIDTHNDGHIHLLNRNWLKEYCGQDQVFIGVRRDSCRCRHPKHIQYVGDNRCYQPYTRGPCPSGQWLVPSSRKEMDCQVCPCPDLADGHHFYWKGHFYGPAGCYRSQTRGPCEEGSTFVMNSLVSNEPHCFINWKILLNRYCSNHVCSFESHGDPLLIKIQSITIENTNEFLLIILFEMYSRFIW